MKEEKALIVLSLFLLTVILYRPKQEKQTPVIKLVQYGNYEKLPDRYYELPSNN